MDVLVDRCAALDVHKERVTACVRRWSATGKRRDNEVRTFSTMLHDLGELRRWATIIGGRYMGEDMAEAFGKRNAVAGELLVRVTPASIYGETNIAGW